MPEELLLRCDSCGLVYNKLTYSECPRCRHIRRKTMAVSGTRPGAGVAPAAWGAAPERPAETASPEFRRLLRGIVLFALGGATAIAGLNVASGRPLFATPITVVRVPDPVASKRCESTTTAAPASVPSTAPPLSAPAESLRVDEITRTVDSRTNTLSVEGLATNVTATDLAVGRVTVTALDDRGSTLATGWAAPSPTPVKAGQQTHFTVRIRNDPAIRRVEVGAEWTHLVAGQLRSEAVGEAESSAP